MGRLREVYIVGSQQMLTCSFTTSPVCDDTRLRRISQKTVHPVKVFSVGMFKIDFRKPAIKLSDAVDLFAICAAECLTRGSTALNLDFQMSQRSEYRDIVRQ